MPESLGLKFSNYPASIERLCELLSTTEGRELIQDELEKAKAQLDSGEKQIQWRYVKRPDYLLEQLADLGVEKKEFPALDTVEVRNEDFITQDEIDYRLTGGSGFEHGKFRIYELNSLIRLVNQDLAVSSDKSCPNIKHHESTSYYYYY